MTQLHPIHMAAIHMALQNPDPGIILIEDTPEQLRALLPPNTPAVAVRSEEEGADILEAYQQELVSFAKSLLKPKGFGN